MITTDSKLAFIVQDGLGVALALRLAEAGFAVSTFVQPGPDADPVDVGTLPKAATLAAAVKSATVVFTLLETPQDVEDAYLGTKGILESANENSYFIDLSTSSPRLARELHALAAVHDNYFADAAFDGDEVALAAGSARIFVGGERDILKLVVPLLALLCPAVYETGLPGTGAAARIATIIAQTSSLMGFVEAASFALQAGLDKEAVRTLLGSGLAASAAGNLLGEKILDEDYFGGVKLRRYFRDLTTALDAAEEMDLTLPSLETAHQLYDLLVLVGGGAMGVHALALIYREEEYCAKYGLNWELAQRAMDVYDQGHDHGFDDDEDDDDYDDDDDCDDPDCGHHHHHHHEGDDGLPGMGGFFSSN